MVEHSFPEVTSRKLRLQIRQGASKDSFARVKEIRLFSGGRQVVPELAPNQAGYFAAPPIVGREDEFCRRAYAVMLRGAAFAKDLYRPWPTQPDCGYLGWGGRGEKEILANIGMCHLYAVLLSFGEYDAEVTGVSRGEALRRVKGVVRYLGYTHYSGSYACVDGGNWGGGWHDSSWSTVFAHTAWLVWDELDEPTREMVARVVAAEADRFVDQEPFSGKIDNTRRRQRLEHALPGHRLGHVSQASPCGRVANGLPPLHDELPDRGRRSRGHDPGGRATRQRVGDEREHSLRLHPREPRHRLSRLHVGDHGQPLPERRLPYLRRVGPAGGDVSPSARRL